MARESKQTSSVLGRGSAGPRIDVEETDSMSTLPFISNKNLISARRYGIELDIEDSCAALAARAMGAQQPGPADPVREADLEAHARTFRAILLHLWPEPADPVVAGMRASARLALAHIEILASRYPAP